ncbi:hypothetical protein [Azospirillum largimobile]
MAADLFQQHRPVSELRRAETIAQVELAEISKAWRKSSFCP